MCIYHLNKLLKKINRAKKEITDVQPSTPSPIRRNDISKPITLASFICKTYALIHVLILTKIAIKKNTADDQKNKKLTFLSLKYDKDICKTLQNLYHQLELDQDEAEDVAYKLFYYNKLLSFAKKIDNAEECNCDEMFTLVEPTKEIILFKAVNFFDTFENFDEM